MGITKTKIISYKALKQDIRHTCTKRDETKSFKRVKIDNEVWVGVGEIDPKGSGSLPETAKLSRAVSQITRDQYRLPHKMS